VIKLHANYTHKCRSKAAESGGFGLFVYGSAISIEQQSTTHLYRITINQTLYEPANAAGSADDHHGRRRPARQGQGRTGVQHLRGARRRRIRTFDARAERDGQDARRLDGRRHHHERWRHHPADDGHRQPDRRDDRRSRPDSGGRGRRRHDERGRDRGRAPEERRGPSNRIFTRRPSSGLQPRERVRPRAGRRGRHTGRPRRHRDPEKRRRDVDDRQGRGAR